MFFEMNACGRRSVMYLLLAAFVVVSIGTSAAAESLWKEWRLVNLPLHAAIEALGGLLGRRHCRVSASAAGRGA